MTISMKTEVHVQGISGGSILDFMLRCTDEEYRRWWPGTHLAFHTIERRPGNLGNLVYFDEYVGRYRLKFSGVVSEIVPGKKVVWQMKRIVKLPGWLALEFEDVPGGVRIVHMVSIGFGGPGRFLDPVLKRLFSSRFEKELAEHAQTEFKRLVEILS